MESNNNQGTVEIITRILAECKIPPNLLGYHYLRYGVLLAYRDNDLLLCMTKGLYPSIANDFNTKWTRVERAMRHALEVSGKSTEGISAMKKYAGEFDDIPCVSQFISGVTDHLCIMGEHIPMFTVESKANSTNEDCS